MKRSPHAIAEQLKEMLCNYLETAHRVSNTAVAEERAELLRSPGVISQVPFVETTPLFKAGSWLRDLRLGPLPSELPDLVRHGLPTERYPLWAHQEAALRAAWNEDGGPGSLVVASGTGSGKTECFYLPILADILREALGWHPPSGPDVVGEWSGRRQEWLHKRRHEERPAALRAIVLYPMNALVNDQLRRLRRTLDSDEALAWQRKHLNGNLIHFGRYTSQTELPGSPSDEGRRRRWSEHRARVQTGWETIGADLRESGGWPRLDGAEMVCRWDMHAAPPDILITNYSMLEYMLVRPIEAGIFQGTREWLASSPEHVLTLVLDEAHTYAGAQGAEVGYLIRRLFERLGAAPEQIRCVATSASLGESPDDLLRVKRFAADLFGHPEDRFTVVSAETESVAGALDPPDQHELQAFARFQGSLEQHPDDRYETSVERASQDLFADLGLHPEGADASQRLYEALRNHPRLLDLRRLTARKAKKLDEAADAVWGDLSSEQDRYAATAGLLSAGSYARRGGSANPDVPPLLPSRLHLMFRGLPGVWACVDPNCPESKGEAGNRVCGKLYGEPRIWCDCSARVLEMFHCRICGLLFLGGIPDGEGHDHRLWPYEKNLESGFQDYAKYRMFALENPSGTRADGQGWAEERRSVLTTAVVDRNDDGGRSRVVWVATGAGAHKRPSTCPRCNAGSVTSGVVVPMRSTGSQPLRVVMEHAFRCQPPRHREVMASGAATQPTPQPDAAPKRRWFKKAASREEPVLPGTSNPNGGRKALIFSDGRQEAATLAGNLTYLHSRDLFRQLLLAVMDEHGRQGAEHRDLPVPELRRRVFDLAVRRGVDPSFGEIERFWGEFGASPQEARNNSAPILDAYLRREIADREVGVESLGLARWVLHFDGETAESIVPALEPFDTKETVALMYAVLRILAGENVVLPADRNPQSWPWELVEPWFRRTIIRPPLRDQYAFSYKPNANNRLTRYLGAVCGEVGIGSEGLDELMDELWEGYLLEAQALMPTVGNQAGWGIPITRLALAPLAETAFVCSVCSYLSAETVRGVCVRCQGACTEVPKEEIARRNRSYYRTLAELAVSDGAYPDPFPLRALEHTAQISATAAATRERHFQDQFVTSGPEEEDPRESRVDLLSVTTTMEMGIDIGDLTTVGMNGAPPTVANYQQRAGRAGRRSDGTAVVLTYAKDRSHDQYYYSRVAEIVTGPVRIPGVHLDNPVIARRHVNSLVLQRYFAGRAGPDGETNLLGAFGSVGSFVRGGDSGLDRLGRLLEGGGFREEALSSARRVLTGGVDEANRWLDELPAVLAEALDKVRDEEDLLSALITRGVLPRYAFPVDLVALWTQRPSRYSRGEEVQRDSRIAISEYAPDAEIVIDGWKHRSAGLYTPYEKSPAYEPDAWFYECPDCHYVQVADRSAEKPGWSECPACSAPLTGEARRTPLPAVKPQGFRTDWAKQRVKYRGGARERSGYTSPAQLRAGETADRGELRLDGRLWVHHRTGDLYAVNLGPPGEMPGFWICPRCGRNLDRQTREHKSLDFRGDCGGRPQHRSVLLHGFQSDVALLAVNLPGNLTADPRRPQGRGAWLSLGAALVRAAAAHLQISASELAVGERPWVQPGGRLLGEIFLYDTLPNGAGYAEEVADEIEDILRRARELCVVCPGRCETACYHCLLDYGNQKQHGLLDRHLAKEILDFLLDGVEPELPRARQLKALQRLRNFASEDALKLNVEGHLGPPGVLTLPGGRTYELRPTHSLCGPPQLATTPTASSLAPPCLFPSEFDLVRRPFWVWGQILEGRTDFRP